MSKEDRFEHCFVVDLKDFKTSKSDKEFWDLYYNYSKILFYDKDFNEIKFEEND